MLELMTTLHEKLLNMQTRLSVIGLGYSGLPIALEFARKIPVIGFDIREDCIETMSNMIDPSEELKHEYGFELVPVTCNA